MSTFTGFSEDDLVRIKSADSDLDNDKKPQVNVRKIDKLGVKARKPPDYKLPELKSLNSEDSIDSLSFDKCKLSIKTPTPNETTVDLTNNNIDEDKLSTVDLEEQFNPDAISNEDVKEDSINSNIDVDYSQSFDSRKSSLDIGPDIVRSIANYTEDELVAHKVKLEQLQLKQKLMEEQNKKRKEMLSKALADRTKQTEEEVIKLEKIKKELQVLDGQLSQDVAVLRKKIDQACHSYAEAEKQYLKIEKDFLQAKINLQKERDKKELLTEHLCALITHNETRKAKKLETLMLQLVDDKSTHDQDTSMMTDEYDGAVIVDGVDERTGKMVEFNVDS